MRPVRGSHRPAPFLAFAVALIAGFPASSAYALDLDVALVASTSVVPAGDEFEVRIDVTDLGPEFNTYEAFVTYDPSRVTFLPASPLSLQEGPYMTGACGNTFHIFQIQQNTLHITHSLLCPDQFLTGPGNIYVLRFRANDTPGTTTVSFHQIAFYRGGFTTSLGTLTDAVIEITLPTDAGGPRASRLQLRVAPNPFNPTTVVSVEAPRAGFQRLLVHDLRGRLVDVLDAGEFPAGVRHVVWSARGADGTPLTSGAYFLTLEIPDGSRTVRAILLK